MWRASCFLLSSVVLLASVAKAPAAGQQCDVESGGAKEPDGNDKVSLMAIRFATKFAPAVQDIKKTGTTKGAARADGVTGAASHTDPLALAVGVTNTVTNVGGIAMREGGAGEPEGLAHRGVIPLALELSSSLASSLALVFVGCNDVVWFFPFAMHSRRWQFIAVYMVLKEFFAFSPWLIVACGHRLEDLYPGVPVEHVLTVATPALLALYAFVLLLEWCQDVDVAVDETSTPPESPPKPPHQSELPASAGCEQRLDLAKLGALCIIGNLDNLAVFIPGLEGGVFKGPQLAIGTFFAGAFVVAACVGASQIRTAARLAESVPLWCILGTLAVWYTLPLLVGGR